MEEELRDYSKQGESPKDGNIEKESKDRSKSHKLIEESSEIQGKESTGKKSLIKQALEKAGVTNTKISSNLMRTQVTLNYQQTGKINIEF